MSVASLNNGSLQLSELVVSNEKYSNASGYVASSSVFSSGVTGTNLNIGGSLVLGNVSNITATSDGGISLQSGTGSLLCGDATIAGSITLGATSQTTELESTSGGLSIANGNGTLYCGGIVSLGGAVFPGTITLGLAGVSGILSCNSGGQLLWNDVVIS